MSITATSSQAGRFGWGVKAGAQHTDFTTVAFDGIGRTSFMGSAFGLARITRGRETLSVQAEVGRSEAGSRYRVRSRNTHRTTEISARYTQVALLMRWTPALEELAVAGEEKGGGIQTTIYVGPLVGWRQRSNIRNAADVDWGGAFGVEISTPKPGGLWPRMLVDLRVTATDFPLTDPRVGIPPGQVVLINRSTRGAPAVTAIGVGAMVGLKY